MIESIVPTGTPTTLTSSPGYRPTADGKYAITCLPPRDGHTMYTPPASTATSSAASREPQPPGSSRLRIRLCHGDFGLMISRSEMYPRSMSARLSGSLPGWK